MTLTPTQSAPKKCIQEAFDADEHAQNLTRWQQQYDQLTPGRFYGGWMKLRCLPFRCSKSTPAKRCAGIAGCGRTLYGCAFQPDQRARVSMGSHSTRSK